MKLFFLISILFLASYCFAGELQTSCPNPPENGKISCEIKNVHSEPTSVESSDDICEKNVLQILKHKQEYKNTTIICEGTATNLPNSNTDFDLSCDCKLTTSATKQ